MHEVLVLQLGPFRSVGIECQTYLLLHQRVQDDELCQQCTGQEHHNRLTIGQGGEHVSGS